MDVYSKAMTQVSHDVNVTKVTDLNNATCVPVLASFESYLNMRDLAPAWDKAPSPSSLIVTMIASLNTKCGDHFVTILAGGTPQNGEVYTECTLQHSQVTRAHKLCRHRCVCITCDSCRSVGIQFQRLAWLDHDYSSWEICELFVEQIWNFV